MTYQSLWVILCRLSEKGKEETVEEMKERDREESGTGMKVNRRNKNIPPLPLPATRIAGLAHCKPISVGGPGDVRYIFLFVLRFYGPVNPMGSCKARSVYLTTRLLDRLSPLSG